MSAALSAAIGFAAAGAASVAATPIAIRLARHTDFYDRPRGYRNHKVPTPFLGGAAVLAGFLVGVTAVGGVMAKLLVLLACAAALCLLGTIDDRVAVAPKWRVIAEALAATALVGAGLGWHTSAGGGVDFVLTLVWVVGLVNAFNLMDNLDGACATVGCVSAAGIGLLAMINGQGTTAGMAFALSGTCAGFLRYNLTRPAKIFLGDGGSMPIGFLVAALGMITARITHLGDAGILTGAMMAGVVIFDTALVVISRTRRGISLMTGGRDHLTHRLLMRLRSPRAVACALACGQATLCMVAVVGDQTGREALVLLASIAVTVGVGAIVVLDSRRWSPAGISASTSKPHPDRQAETALRSAPLRLVRRRATAR